MKRLALIAMVCLIAGACGGDENRKNTFPVSGKVLVDGKPVKDLAVACVAVKGLDKENPSMSSAFTDENGEFQFNTYEKGDGVPEGEYALTFRYGKFNLVTRSYGEDKFKGKYADAAKSDFKITVSADKAKDGDTIDLGTFELKTK